ncbi:MAG: MBL fold metallo-hydrolase [Lachnospiraceae bacterium]|nr:MBL fold metallo-hydrolase [Lachnospiraceae bacterium]
MKLNFIGAAHEVTGSCHVIEACGKTIFVDYGMEQGRNIYENAPLPVAASDVDFVLLTHAHIDHSGLLPLLYSHGFRGRILTTEATRDLCDIMLRDSAHIQMFEAEWRSRKNKRAGKEEITPLYTMEDACGVMEHFEGYPYNTLIDLCDGIQIRFADVGHLLGSASIEVHITEDGVTKKLIFSGDIGNLNQPLIRDPQAPGEADYVIIESTYGNRYHNAPPDYSIELAAVIQKTFDRGGNLVIPSFAVGRTQELLYFIRDIKERELVHGHDDFEVFVDSPLAVEATTIFTKNEALCFDEEAKELLLKGINPIQFKGLRLSITSDDSKAINFYTKPKVIISASGMCEAGRIRHHLKHNLWRKECTILFVGYQAVGTLGRSLVEGGLSEVKLFGESIDVKAEIQVLPGISGHADHDGLLHWLHSITPKPSHVFIVHGDDKVCDEFAACLHDEHGYTVDAPYSGSIFDLAEGAWIKEAVPVILEPKKASAVHADNVFARLLAAGQRLMTVIRRNEGGANKDLAKFTSQINSLCDKWDR